MVPRLLAPPLADLALLTSARCRHSPTTVRGVSRGTTSGSRQARSICWRRGPHHVLQRLHRAVAGRLAPCRQARGAEDDVKAPGVAVALVAVVIACACWAFVRLCFLRGAVQTHRAGPVQQHPRCDNHSSPRQQAPSMFAVGGHRGVVGLGRSAPPVFG